MVLSDAELEQARRDPAVFADLVLREPLWDHQVEVVTSSARYRVLCAGRRAGKTRVFGVLALHRMFAVPGSRVLMVSAGRTSVVRTHREIAGMARGELTGQSIEDDQVMTLRLSNGSVLESVTQSVNAVRSADVDLLIIDEAGFVEQSVWESAEPTIGARPGARVLIASTPWRGPGHFFHDLWRQGIEKPDEEVRSWHWPSTVSPWVRANTAWLEGMRGRSAPDYYEREYLAEWSASSGSFFESAEIDDATAEDVLVWDRAPAEYDSEEFARQTNWLMVQLNATTARSRATAARIRAAASTCSGVSGGACSASRRPDSCGVIVGRVMPAPWHGPPQGSRLGLEDPVE